MTWPSSLDFKQLGGLLGNVPLVVIGSDEIGNPIPSTKMFPTEGAKPPKANRGSYAYW